MQSRLALVNFLWASNRRPEAEQTLKDALAQDPNNIQAHRALGVFYMSTGRAAEAEPHFQAIATAAKTSAASLALADYYIVTKRPDDATKLLRDLASKDESLAPATMRLAALDVSTVRARKRWPSSAALVEKKPKEMTARLMIARILLVDGKRDEALAEATKIVTEEPNNQWAANAFA